MVDRLSVDCRVTNRVGDLTGLYAGNLIGHDPEILLRTHLRHEIDDCLDALRNGLGRNHHDPAGFADIAGLIGCKNDIGVVREDVYHIGIRILTRSQNIVGARIHGLSAADDVGCADAAEDLCHAVASAYGNHCIRKSLLRRGFLLRLFRCFLLFCQFLRILDQLFLMLDTHVIDLHIGQEAVAESFLNRVTRLVRVNVNLDNVIQRDKYDGITDGFQITAEFVLLLLAHLFFGVDDELGAVSELDIRVFNGTVIRSGVVGNRLHAFRHQLAEILTPEAGQNAL